MFAPHIARLRPVFAFLVIVGTIAAVPLAWRVILRATGAQRTKAALEHPARYLPALEDERERRPFNSDPIQGLKDADPAYVLIGDSMAGRIDFAHFEELTQGRLAPLLQNATGSTYWYLAFKNWVVASGVRPKWVMVFFRDTNLTDPLFRIGDPGYRHLDEVALEREDELNAILADWVDPWFRVHRAVSRFYQVEQARAWVDPKLSDWAVTHAVPIRRRRTGFLDQINTMFGLDRLRPMPAADIAAAEDRDTVFAGNVDRSVLPLFVRLAKEHDLHLCFVRVLRRPRDDGSLEPQSPKMDRYMRDLRAYLEANGAVLRDDRDDPYMATIEYADGDHIGRAERTRYTDRFVATTPIFK
jgi:hypothetical protein